MSHEIAFFGKFCLKGGRGILFLPPGPRQNNDPTNVPRIVSPGEGMPGNHDGGDIAHVGLKLLHFFHGYDWCQGSQLSIKLSRKGKYFSFSISISILTNPGNFVFKALVWFSSKPIIQYRFLIQEVEAAL